MFTTRSRAQCEMCRKTLLPASAQIWTMAESTFSSPLEGLGSLARLRLHPEHTRFVDTLHQFGTVLITDVPGLIPFNEAFCRPAWVLTEDLLPFLARLLLVAELAQDREIVNIGVKRRLVGT